MKNNTKKERKNNMNDNLARVPEKYTYEDYKKYNDRCELIDGKLYSMNDGHVIDIGHVATYEDYKKYNDEHRVELIDGEFIKMTAPSRQHQDLVGEIFLKLVAVLKGKPCKVYISPTDVILENHETFQPDLFIVCDKNKLKDEGIFGAPDVTIEIISKSDAKRDKIYKYSKYAEYGVENYIMIDPINNEILQSKLNHETGFYDTKRLEITDDVIIRKGEEEISFNLKDSEALKMKN